MQMWGYLQVHRNQDDYVDSINGEPVLRQGIRFYDYINKIGEEGWELVSIRGDSACVYIFKRPKP